MKRNQKNYIIFSKSEIKYMNNLSMCVPTPFFTNSEIIHFIKLYRSTRQLDILYVIVNNFIKLLIKYARKYKRQNISVGDLIHYGVEGIIEAISKTYILHAKEKFITYITIIVERRMKDGLDAHRGAVNLPKNIMTQQRKLVYKNSDDLVIYSKLNIGDITEFKQVFKDNGIEIYSSTVEDDLDKESLQFDVFRILEVLLTRIEREVIIHSFGLNGESIKAFDAISSLLNVPAQKIRKIRNQALYKIKNNEKAMIVLKKYLT